MKKFFLLSLFFLSFIFVGNVSANCGCGTPKPTSTPQPTSTPTPSPTITPTPVPNPTPNSDGNGSLTPAGAPICTASQPTAPIVTSIIRKPTSATLTWTKVQNANHYLIFFGTKVGSQEFGVPDTGNTTTFTINALNPKLKYYFDVRSVNDCMPSNPSVTGQVLGASTTRLAGTDSDLIIPRAIFGIIAAGVTFCFVKKDFI